MFEVFACCVCVCFFFVLVWSLFLFSVFFFFPLFFLSFVFPDEHSQNEHAISCLSRTTTVVLSVWPCFDGTIARIASRHRTFGLHRLFFLCDRPPTPEFFWRRVFTLIIRLVLPLLCRSYCAVGTFEPAIEIWNLDVLDPLEPTATLGGYKEKDKKAGKK